MLFKNSKMATTPYLNTVRYRVIYFRPFCDRSRYLDCTGHLGFSLEIMIFFHRKATRIEDIIIISIRFVSWMTLSVIPSQTMSAILCHNIVL